MKPLNDHELGDLLRSKINATAPEISAESWNEIKTTLADNSKIKLTYLVPSVLVGILILGGLFYIQNGIHKTDANFRAMEYPSSEETPKISHKEIFEESVENKAPSSPIKITNDQDRFHNNLILPWNNESNEISNPSSREIDGFSKEGQKELIHQKDDESIVGNLPPQLKSKDLLMISSNPGPPLLNLNSVPNSNARISQYYIDFNTYLTFHTLTPSRTDELRLTGDLDNRPTLADRIGFQFKYGRMFEISPRIRVTPGINIDYYQTLFYARVVNQSDPDLRLSNHRIDLGASFGLEYLFYQLPGTHTLLVEIGARHKIINLQSSDDNAYKSLLFTGKIAYLVKIHSFQIGPSYSTIFNATVKVTHGQLMPRQYGFMIRKDL